MTHPQEAVSSTVSMTKSPISPQTWLQSRVASFIFFILISGWSYVTGIVRKVKYFKKNGIVRKVRESKVSGGTGFIK
jgi:hypothetical protein